VAAVIQLRSAPPAKPKRKQAKRQPTRQQLLVALHAQSTQALAGDWTFATELRALAAAARNAKPWARSICWSGVRFPIKRGLLIASVRCPKTDRALVGVVD
jgi:hypothetical protein